LYINRLLQDHALTLQLNNMVYIGRAPPGPKFSLANILANWIFL